MNIRVVDLCRLTILSGSLALILGCVAPGQVHDLGGGMALVNPGRADQVTLYIWYNLPPLRQAAFVSQILDAFGSTGGRCPTVSVSAAAVRFEILTRINQGRLAGRDNDRLFEWVYIVLADAGCGVEDLSAGFVPLSIKIKDPTRATEGAP